MLTLLSLCALAALCAADSSPEADAQFNYGGQGGNNYYQPPQPRHYGSGSGKGGGCRDKKCTKTIEVTQTSFSQRVKSTSTTPSSLSLQRQCPHPTHGQTKL
ncbi:unnamed protein product [Meganyctiphanes norvegica]|uniref:Uncharacterized protein n=1 Tax=Meganyctiphanes norvegica TaxID=48144 RepID=A0AAV2PL98_MEGNR